MWTPNSHGEVRSDKNAHLASGNGGSRETEVFVTSVVVSSSDWLPPAFALRLPAKAHVLLAIRLKLSPNTLLASALCSFYRQWCALLMDENGCMALDSSGTCLLFESCCCL